MNFQMEKSTTIKLIYVESDPKILDAVDYRLTFSLFTDSASENSASDHDISMAKVITFIDSVIHNSLVMQPDSDGMFEKLAEFENNIIMLPNNLEATLIAALHAKLNAIIQEASYIDKIVLEDLKNDLKFTMYTLDEDYGLPNIGEWMGPYSYWSDCWWNRSDASTVDQKAKDEVEHQQWLEIAKEQNLEAIGVQVFKDIENYFDKQSKPLPAGQVLEVDFTKKKSTLTLVDE